MAQKSNPDATPVASESELNETAVPQGTNESTEEVYSANLNDRVSSVVSDSPAAEEDDSHDEPAQAPAPKKKRRSALSSESRKAPTPEAPRNFDHQTISAIPVGPDEKNPVPIFEREASQLKFDEELSSRTDTASIYATLKSYLNQGRALKGKIAGITMYNGVPCWSIFQGQISIYIPFMESYMTIKKNMSGPLTEERIRDQKNFLAQSIGLTVEFILTSFRRDPEHPDCFIATASRTTALARKRAAYLSGDTLRPGADIVCRVISVSSKEMFITVAGLDIYVPRKRITRRYVKHLNDYYHVDDRIIMRIIEIKPGDSKTLPHLALSAIPLEEERCQANRHRLKPGERCRAVISWLDDGSKNRRTTGRINMWLIDYDYYATSTINFASSDKPLDIGTNVLYEHNGFTDMGFSHGKVLRVLP